MSTQPLVLNNTYPLGPLISLDSFLDNLPNYLVGCIIQKRMSREPSSSPPQKKNPHQKNIIMMYNFNLLGLPFFLFLVAYIMKIQCIPYWIYHLVKWKAIAFKGVTTPIRACLYSWVKNRDEGKTPRKVHSLHTASNKIQNTASYEMFPTLLDRSK